MAIEEGAWAACVCISDTGDGGQLRFKEIYCTENSATYKRLQNTV
jgi:hypothetical protein